MDRWRTSYLLLVALCVLPLGGCSARQNSSEVRPFFQQEIATETHGKKTLFDRIVEVDPGGLEVELARDYELRPPETIAVLPFTDRGSAQYTVNKIPLSFRDKEQRDQWAWTDAQRLRKAFVGYLSEREFTVVNPIAVDAVLQSHGIDNAEDLEKVSLPTLGKWFHCDAVVYGTVDHYEAYYFALVSGYEVGVSSRMVSTHDGETLTRSSGSRYSLNVLPAITMQDILINSAESLLQLRDVVLARAEEEVARELVIRIPRSDTLRARLATEAVRRAGEAEEVDEEAMEPLRPPDDATETENAPSPSANETRFLQAVAVGDDAASDEQAVEENGQHSKTARSWQLPAGQRFVPFLSKQQR